MEWRYLRFQIHDRLRRYWSPRIRRRRMRRFVRIAALRPGMRVLDLGGAPGIWESVSVPLDITLLNLPGAIERAGESHHRFTYVEGDACAVEQFRDGEFDLVFSNSVIEHVGPEERQGAFAREVVRLGRSYWVQTPSKWFPIEVHCGMPFWWFYPESLRAAILQRWRRKLPAWTEMVATTRVIKLGQMRRWFVGSRLIVEYALCFPKSYTAYRLDQSDTASVRG